MCLADFAHDRRPWPFFHFCSRLARETFFAQVLPHALRTCAALPLAKRSGAPGVTLLDGSYLYGARRSWRARPYLAEIKRFCLFGRISRFGQNRVETAIR